MMIVINIMLDWVFNGPLSLPIYLYSLVLISLFIIYSNIIIGMSEEKDKM